MVLSRNELEDEGDGRGSDQNEGRDPARLSDGFDEIVVRVDHADLFRGVEKRRRPPIRSETGGGAFAVVSAASRLGELPR
jgi:hypothetical protein